MKDLGVRLGVIAFALLCSLWILLCASEQANAKPEEDLSDPILVQKYLTMPCDAMEDSYEFMYNRIQRTSQEYVACVELSKTSTYKYRGLMCVWIEQDFQFRYTHMKSLERAYILMCGEDGQRKEKEVPIDF